MGADSKIEWTDHTFNPWLGCTKISPACANCYAEGWAKRSGLVQWGDQAQRRRTSVTSWKAPLKWNTEAKATGVRRRVFCASLADVFEDRSELLTWRLDLFDLIRQTPHLDWLLLTKRPQNILPLVEAGARTINGDDDSRDDLLFWLGDWFGVKPPENVWLGTTVENQEQADKRIPELLKIPARVRFLSVEPMLGPINLWKWLPDSPTDTVDWVIVGGESGPNARPMAAEWLTSLRDQCLLAGVPVFIKQLGAVMAQKFRCRDPKGGDMSEWPAEYRVRQFPTIAV
jgi:protein gp37